MKRIAISALKGGVGKTTTSCSLALALTRRGKKVGIAEIDVTGSSLWKALGLPKPPELQADTKNQTIIPSKIFGLEVFTIASVFKASTALMWKGGTEEVKGHVLEGTGKYELVKQMLRDVAFSPDLDYLIYDCPPNVGEDVLSLWDNLPDIWGVVIVTQPTSLSREGVMKTIDMLKFKKLPVLGVIINMDGVVCPNCKTQFSPFLDTEDFDDLKMPILGRIPFSNLRALEVCFDAIAGNIEQAKVLKNEASLMQRVIMKTKKTVITRLAPIILKRLERGMHE